MDDDNSKCEKGVTKVKDNCDIVNLGKLLLDIISNIMGCNCKK